MAVQTIGLQQLLAECGYECQSADDQEITGVTADSRAVQSGFVFVAVAGVSVNGHEFIEDAVARGACLVVVEAGHVKSVPRGCETLTLADTREGLAQLAACFYRFPAQRMRFVGVTGTNGKTTCSYLIESVLQEAGFKTGLIGTVSYRFGSVERAASHTTPDAVQLQRLLAEMADDGVTHVVMEVSSHALTQGRVAGISFAVALFTNLSRDHLDYHRGMADYFAAKRRLFTEFLSPQGIGVVVDDGGQGWSDKLVAALSRSGRKIVVCGRNRDVSYGNVRFSLRGIQADVEVAGRTNRVTSPLVGEFNLQNILGTMGVGKALGVEPTAMIQGLKFATGAPGRMEQIVIQGAPHPAVFVDYAHTPDALEKVLATLTGLTRKRVIVVFGCGGDRDRGKRSLMGWVAAQGADIAIATSDNPRSEDPMRILQAIEVGMQDAGGTRFTEKSEFKGHGKGYLIIESRREAIACAITIAEKDDVVLISGKGHETYQETRAGRICFDDRLEATQQLQQVWGRADETRSGPET
ncbi:MAG: UDP-N-acetylmuramoyl-L-alanyl-D-glutamate--2,6-diaminopimelate ligase [Desulfobulbaceae bacterium]|nr:UDP-N-acetylmuramoyl-L-alanyl-D-glutamate--2,6-diaminopimelate ligase [Desulfobulbaceae bacterium]